jgi:hypothetical protein
MKWFSLKVVALAVVALAIGSLSVKETAAQYPPPTGSASLSGSSTTASVGGDISLTLTVVDSTGSPVAGKTCTMYIYSQPGTDASVTQDSAATDAAGVITGTLYVGTTQGTVEVRVSCGDVFAAFTSVVGVAAPPQAPVEPGQIALPPTGVGPVAYSESSGVGLIAALLVTGIVALAAGSALLPTARRVRGGS